MKRYAKRYGRRGRTGRRRRIGKARLNPNRVVRLRPGRIGFRL